MKALTTSILLTLAAASSATAQGSAPTPLDRGIRRQDNKIDGSLCKGC